VGLLKNIARAARREIRKSARGKARQIVRDRERRKTAQARTNTKKAPGKRPLKKLPKMKVR